MPSTQHVLAPLCSVRTYVPIHVLPPLGQPAAQVNSTQQLARTRSLSTDYGGTTPFLRTGTQLASSQPPLPPRLGGQRLEANGALASARLPACPAVPAASRNPRSPPDDLHGAAPFGVQPAAAGADASRATVPATDRVSDDSIGHAARANYGVWCLVSWLLLPSDASGHSGAGPLDTGVLASLACCVSARG